MNQNPKYPGCWICDNLVDYPEQIGLLHLGFPRCFVLVPANENLYFGTFEEFVNHTSEVNWLDPSDKGTAAEQQEVLRTIWNFSVEAFSKEDEMMDGFSDCMTGF